MKLNFESDEYIEIYRIGSGVMLSIASRHPSKPKSLMINSAEMTLDQFKQLVSDILQEKDK